MTEQHDHDPLQPHAHDPNPHPPSEDPRVTVSAPASTPHALTVADLHELPQTEVSGCYIVSTGHGTSGPFTFGGVRLLDVVQTFGGKDWRNVEVISADGFGNRVSRDELLRASAAGPIILATTVNGRPLTRDEGLVRLIVPSERDDALRQVKWVAQIKVRRAAD